MSKKKIFNMFLIALSAMLVAFRSMTEMDEKTSETSDLME